MSEEKSYIRKGKITKHMWPKGTDQDAWLALRAKMSGEGDEETVRLGASEVSVATGSNTFQSAQRLFFKLTGYHQVDVINETLIAGHLMEPLTAIRWEGFVPGDMEQSCRNSVNGVRLNKVKKAKFFLTNSAYPYLSVSLDYVPMGKQFSPFTGEKYATLTPHELKHTNENYYKLWPVIEQGGRKIKIARPYYEQLQIQMLVSGTTLGVFHVMVDGKSYHCVEVERDNELLEEILPKIEAFVENVKKGKRLVRMMRELLETGESEDSDMYQTYQNMFNDITPDFGTIKDQLELSYEIQPESNLPKDQFKKASAHDDELLDLYLEQNAVIKEAEGMKIKLRSELVHSAGKWHGIRHSNDTTRMINRRADPDTGKKAYFSIA